MTSNIKDDFGFTRASGPSDAIIEIARVINFVETAMRATLDGTSDRFVDDRQINEAMHELLYASQLELRRIAEVVPVSNKTGKES